MTTTYNFPFGGQATDSIWGYIGIPSGMGSGQYFTLPVIGGTQSAPAVLGTGDALHANVNAENIMTSAGSALVATWNRIIPTANITITIPSAAASAGAHIGIIIDKGAASYLVTLQDAAGAYIDYDDVNGVQTGRTTRIMWAGEVCHLYSNGTYWHKVSGKTIPMQSSLGATGNLTFSSGAYSLLSVFTASLFNNAPSAFQVSASNKFVCLRPGNYNVTLMFMVQGTNNSTGNSVHGAVYKNGAQGPSWTSYAPASQNTGNSLTVPMTLAVIDYFQPYGYYSSGSYTTTFINNDSGAGNQQIFCITEVPVW